MQSYELEGLGEDGGRFGVELEFGSCMMEAR